MSKFKNEQPRGILYKESGADHFSLSRFCPCEKLAFFVEHYWIVKWDLRGQEPYDQNILSHPSVHLVFEKENTWFWGVVSGKYTRRLDGKGKVVGVKFRPGAFYPFYQKPVSGFTDAKLEFTDVFDEDIKIIESQILGHKKNQHMIEEAENFLINYLPERDSKIENINNILDIVKDDPSILKVDDLTDRFMISKRTLQRLFKNYVGVSPKWVIQRYRLHEAAEKMASGFTDNWPQIAMDLGYFDQSHFIKDFRKIVGRTPKDYLDNL
ncbi:helix-turn-helix transcriptional regulator [Rhodohalobacter sulfatireducens]|uniref:Helix-turn-helix transcriptional regulator n=1 Tax=Rhodohalobacter sulfatireducens TaxID=2911366 RepID=A0ABS9KFP6_9BACT|nr:helix-turn-helix transcriptional regulator [Rhodohalobacter sulfatireducens]MCG2589682.1 helix-turn-helix transcriptional regulator [Rhodohalobacter sulfatireducens]